VKGRGVKANGGMGKERDGNGREGAEGKKRVEKGEGKLDLDICPGPRVPSYATVRNEMLF